MNSDFSIFRSLFFVHRHVVELCHNTRDKESEKGIGIDVAFHILLDDRVLFEDYFLKIPTDVKAFAEECYKTVSDCYINKFSTDEYFRKDAELHYAVDNNIQYHLVAESVILILRGSSPLTAMELMRKLIPLGERPSMSELDVYLGDQNKLFVLKVNKDTIDAARRGGHFDN